MIALTTDGQPWWEGLDSGTPVKDWQGKPYTPGQGHAAHPNARFTVSAKQNPIYSKLADAPEADDDCTSRLLLRIQNNFSGSQRPWIQSKLEAFSQSSIEPPI
ncbi:MAG: phosphoenolpyruvate carboxykinase (GTP) [Rhizobiales bacterium]|nr:phosphoenolpyruvate carboxykinase (GTP) [Hyphomicrobiales bacterium]